ncbi:MAG: hypothetical protein ACKVTZ_12550 [Bacteroidia bacterium]
MMKRTILTCVLFPALSLSLVFGQVEKKKVYTLKEGETLLTAESYLGLNPTVDGLTLTVGDSEGKNTIISSTGKRFGPFDGPIMESRNYQMDGLAGASFALIAGKQKGEGYEYTVIMNDSKELGTFENMPFVLFDDTEDNWALEEHWSKQVSDDTYTNYSKVQFKNGKAQQYDGNVMVSFNPYGQGWVLNNLKNDGTTEITYSDGKKQGPYELILNPIYLENGSGYAFVGGNKGKYFFSIAGKETPITTDYPFSYYLNADGSDWVVENSNEDNTVHSLTFKNGKTTENYDALVVPVSYEKANKRWLYGGQKGNEIYVYYSDGTQVGPFAFSAEYPGAILFANKDASQWCLSYSESDSKFVNVYNIKGTTRTQTFANKGGENTSVMGNFTPDGRLYFSVTTYVENSDEHTTELHFVDNKEVINLGDSGDEIHFSPSGRTRWSMGFNNGSLLVESNGKKETYKNVFSIRYDNKSSKLYWLSLEGTDLYLNTLTAP